MVFEGTEMQVKLIFLTAARAPLFLSRQNGLAKTGHIYYDTAHPIPARPQANRYPSQITT